MWLVANLDAEARWRGEDLSPRAAGRLAGLAPLLSVLGAPGDRLAGSRPPTRVAEAARAWLPLLPHDEVPLAALDGRHVLAWSAAGVAPRAGRAEGATWRERLRDAPRCEEAIARRVHNKSWLAAERAEGTLPAHPNGIWIATPADLQAAAAVPGPWVLKAPFGAAGRDRVLNTRAAADAATWSHAHRALSAWGGGLFERWLTREEDLGAIGIVTETDVWAGGCHRLITGPDGRFRAIERVAPRAARTALVEALDVALPLVGARLRYAGYCGPFGVDAYAGWDATGQRHLVAVGEVNARLTFGHLAACLFEGATGAGRTLHRLVLGAVDPGALDPDAVPLVETVDGREVRAWLEGDPAS